MGQLNVEEGISLLVAVTQITRLECKHGVRQVVEDLGERVTRRLGLRLHHKELGHHAPVKVRLREHEREGARGHEHEHAHGTIHAHMNTSTRTGHARA